MPGIIMEENALNNVAAHELNLSDIKEDLTGSKSQRISPGHMNAPSEAQELPVEGRVEPSIQQLYANLCDIESSTDGTPSRQSFGSDGEESRIDLELHHLVGGKMEAVKVIEEEEDASVTSENETENESSEKKQESATKNQSPNLSSASSRKSKRPPRLVLRSDASIKSTSKEKESPVTDENTASKPLTSVASSKNPSIYSPGEGKVQNGLVDPSDAGLGNPDLGPFLLKHARDFLSSDNPRRALKYALRAAKSFEICSGGKSSLDLVMSLHVIAAIYCNLGQYVEAVPVLQQSIEIPVLEQGQEHCLAKFSGYMQLGDTYAMLGQLESSIQCYATGLEIQRQVLGDMDPRVGETCRYLAEAHVQALQFDEAERLCKVALDIHRAKGEPSSLEETADRRLMGLICETKGEHEVALEHLVMASMSMVANGLDAEVATVDSSIGDIYLSLARYDEAVFSYQKALTVFKTTKGENHSTVASVFVRLADLYNRIGKFKESKSYCENALRIYSKSIPGTSSDEIASGLIDVSAIYVSMNEHEQAIKLLQKALKMYNKSAGQQNTIASIEAQMGVLYYILGNYGESYASFKSAITKLRACGEKKSAFFGIALNQMGLACIHSYAINEAAELFEEAKNILEQEYGSYHPDTLGVYSNLAGAYDAMGRLDEAIEILEYIVGLREKKLGTANPDVDDEKGRLAELLKEAGRVRNRKSRSLETLMDTNPHTLKKSATAAV